MKKIGVFLLSLLLLVPSFLFASGFSGGGGGILIEYDIGNSGANKTIDPANGGRQEITLTDDCTITWTQPASGTATVLLKVIQATGNHYNIVWTTTLWLSSSGVPTITATDAAVDLISCYLDGINIFCVASQDFQ